MTNRTTTFTNRAHLSEGYATGERAIAELKQRLNAVRQTEPGELSPAQLAKFEAGFAATVTQLEELQTFIKRMMEAETEAEFEVAIHACAAQHLRNPRPAYEAYVGELK